MRDQATSALFQSDAMQMRASAHDYRYRATLYPDMSEHLIAMAEHYEAEADIAEAKSHD